MLLQIGLGKLGLICDDLLKLTYRCFLKCSSRGEKNGTKLFLHMYNLVDENENLIKATLFKGLVDEVV
jgi:hypothetical protein